jgi:hypothetical protein
MTDKKVRVAFKPLIQRVGHPLTAMSRRFVGDCPVCEFEAFGYYPTTVYSQLEQHVKEEHPEYWASLEAK